MNTLKACDLSIIIPCHNLEGYISKCLGSIFRQETKYIFEIICVIDRCTDKTKWIIENLSPRVTCPIKCISADVGSCGTARNIGLEHATGKYIWFIDGDDWITDTSAIETIIQSFDEETDIVLFGYQSQGYHHVCYEMVWQYVYRRETIGQARFRAMQPSEDYAFQSSIFSKNPRIKKIGNTFYHYNYPREGSVMWKAYNGLTEENIEAR